LERGKIHFPWPAESDRQAIGFKDGSLNVGYASNVQGGELLDRQDVMDALAGETGGQCLFDEVGPASGDPDHELAVSTTVLTLESNSGLASMTSDSRSPCRMILVHLIVFNRRTPVEGLCCTKNQS
jgi:hypothetical protein